MAAVHYTARVQENGSLDIPKEKQQELGIQPGDAVQVVLFTDESSAAELPPFAEGESLADFLGEFIGCIEGSGANNSENTGEKFTEYLVQKHNKDHL